MEVPANEITTLTELIENSPTPDGSITINGIEYLYRNCDVLIADLRTPDPSPVPSVSEWGIILMAGALFLTAITVLRRNKIVELN